MPNIEHEEPKNTLVTVYLVVSTFAIFAIFLMVYIYFKAYTQDQLHAKVELAPTQDLDDLRQRETLLLGQDANGQMKQNYEAVDASKGIYRIPIERAMELQVESSWRKGMPRPTPLPAGAQTTATTTNATTTTHTTP